jgi:hypothetical protein
MGTVPADSRIGFKYLARSEDEPQGTVNALACEADGAHGGGPFGRLTVTGETGDDAA